MFTGVSQSNIRSRGEIVMNLRLLLLIISLFSASPVFSQLYDGHSLTQTSLQALVGSVQPGSILLLGENHGLQSHRDQHMQVLEALKARGLKLSVGLEFINYTDQGQVDAYRNAKIDETEFLKNIVWSGFPFELYKSQLNFGEFSLGLNLPRNISSKISKSGLESLTIAERALLPTDFALGRDSYRERFMVAAGAHCKNPQNCFVAQCSWDDTMATTATRFLAEHPEQVLVIVVGEFHVQFGGGLAYRIQQRSPGILVTSLSQIWAEDMTEEEINQSLQASPVEGVRADFIWVSRP